jgi:3-deoxy-D-manno-octulosonate 8-phosphate phosphatase KdsC-like HAD superfamily phosphatase
MVALGRSVGNGCEWVTGKPHMTHRGPTLKAFNIRYGYGVKETE